MKQYTTSSSSGCTSAVDDAMVQHNGLVHWVVHRQWLGHLSYMEAVQAGLTGLWRAWQGYDPHRGTTFSTYAVPAITRAVWRAVKQAQPNSREILMPHPPQGSPAMEEAVQGVLVVEALQQLVATMPPRLRYVITARYGLQGQPAESFVTIGRSLGVSGERARQLHTEALLWLGHPAHSVPLRKLLDRNSPADYQAYLARLRQWLRAQRTRR
jgi:RNA polymerase sigma factor (sigma-70 family)